VFCKQLLFSGIDCVVLCDQLLRYALHVSQPVTFARALGGVCVCVGGGGICVCSHY
jgi:hypothetical protein